MKNLTLALALFLAGCGTLNQQYVTADRKDYDVFAPLIEKWLAAEPGLALDPTMEEVDDYIKILELKLKTRGVRITEAEKLLEDK